MSIVITTPTGHIGSVVAKTLLDAGEKITLIARDPAKVKALTDRGARLVKGSHADAALFTEATKGATALFFLVPPDWGITDIRAGYRRFGEAAAKAISANKIPYVVNLSSVGADKESGNGPVAGLHVTEKLLREAATNLVQLRPGYFMENTMGQIPAILQAGALFTTFQGRTKFGMIATRDIGARAAELLRARDWKGEKVVELQGAGDVSYDEVAATLSEVLGRPLKHVTVGREQLVESLTGMGASRVLAESFHELTQGIESGHVKPLEPRSATNTTPTSYPVFAQEVFKPAFKAATAG